MLPPRRCRLRGVCSVMKRIFTRIGDEGNAVLPSGVSAWRVATSRRCRRVPRIATTAASLHRDAFWTIGLRTRRARSLPPPERGTCTPPTGRGAVCSSGDPRAGWPAKSSQSDIRRVSLALRVTGTVHPPLSPPRPSPPQYHRGYRTRAASAGDGGQGAGGATVPPRGLVNR